MSAQKAETQQKTFKDRLHAVDAWFANHRAACAVLMMSGLTLAGGTMVATPFLSSPSVGGIATFSGFGMGTSASAYGLIRGTAPSSESVTKAIKPLIGTVVSISAVYSVIVAGGIAVKPERQNVDETTSITEVANDADRREAFLNAFHQAHHGNYPATATFETENGQKHKVRIPAPTP